MGRSNSRRKDTETIYRSRQSGRTDIEELLGPTFDPEQQPAFPSVGATPPVGRTPAVGHPSASVFPSFSNGLEVGNATKAAASPAVVATPSEGVAPTVVIPPTVGATSFTPGSPTSGLRESPEEKTNRSTVNAPPGTHGLPRVGVGTENRLPPSHPALPSVGVPPTVRDMAPSEIAPVWVSISSGRMYPASRVKRIDIAQHSMSMGENHLYQALWVMHRTEYFRLLFESKQLRRFSAGYDVLARVGRLNEKSIRDLLPKLKQKLVITEIAEADPMTRKGKTYEVFSYQQILARQREAGLSFVVNNGKAVEFAIPQQSRVGDTPALSVGVSPTVGVTCSEGQPHTGSVGEPPGSPVGVSPTLLDRERQAIRQTSSSLEGRSEWNLYDEPSTEKGSQRSEPADSPAPAALVEGIRRLVPVIDHEAVSLLWRQCRNRAHDCTAEEILYFSHGKANILRSGKIQNPTGFLLIAVPKCFEGSSFRDYRREREQAKAAEVNRTKQAEIELEDAQRQLHEMLNNPDSTDEDRRFARRLLGLEND